MHHDPGYKLLFSHARMVEDLLRGFVPEDWVQGLDYASLEKVSASTLSDDLRERHNDVIWRIRWTTPHGAGHWLYVYLMLEFQSRVDPWMVLRVLAYVALLYQDLIRAGLVKTGAQLPPVMPIVLYNGDPPWTAARTLNTLMEPLPGLETYRPDIRYLLLDEQHYDEQELAEIPGLAQALFRLERSRTPEAMNEVVGILADALKGPAHAELQRAFLVFLLQGLLPARLPGVELPAMNDLSEVHAMLSERVKEWTEQWKQQGLDQGLAQGLEAGRRREAGLVLKQLQRRIGLIPAALTEQIQDLPLERIEALGEALLDFTALADLENWLRQH